MVEYPGRILHLVKMDTIIEAPKVHLQVLLKTIP